MAIGAIFAPNSLLVAAVKPAAPSTNHLIFKINLVLPAVSECHFGIAKIPRTHGGFIRMTVVFVALLTTAFVYTWVVIAAFGRITVTTGAIPSQRLIGFDGVMTFGLAITCDVIIFHPADFNEARIFIFVVFIIFMAIAASRFRMIFKMRDVGTRLWRVAMALLAPFAAPVPILVTRYATAKAYPPF